MRLAPPNRVRRRVAAAAGAALAGVLLVGWCARTPQHDLVAAPPPAALAPSSPRREGPAPAPAPRAPPGRVECQLSEPIDPAVDVWVDEIDPDTLEPVTRHLATVSGAWVQFTPSVPEGVGRLSTSQHRPRALGWIDGACLDLLVLERLPTRTVRGRVSGQIEVGGVSVHARCDGERSAFSGSLSADGGFALALPTDEACTLVVRRVFGDDVLEVEAATVPPGGDDLDGLALDGPVAPGAGVGLFRVDGGLRVQDLERDGPAARAGLRRFDLVVAVDGVSAEELDLEALLPLEPPARLEVERDGELLELVVR